VEADETEVDKKATGEEGNLLRNGKAQSGKEKNQEKAGVDEGFGVI
jgi:hypothetical protein